MCMYIFTSFAISYGSAPYISTALACSVFSVCAHLDLNRQEEAGPDFLIVLECLVQHGGDGQCTGDLWCILVHSGASRLQAKHEAWGRDDTVQGRCKVQTRKMGIYSTPRLSMSC